MNLTHKSMRDHLAPVNTNYVKNPQLQLNEKQITSNIHKNDNDHKIENLQQIIQTLTYQNESMNAMIRTKNQQIMNLKNQLKVQPGTVVGQQGKQIRQIYHMNNFRPLNGEPLTTNSTQLDKAMYQIRVLTKQRDDLLKRCQVIQQQYTKNQPVSYTTPKNNNQDLIKNDQHAKVIQQYEQHIASMASKLSISHQLQIQNTQLKQEKIMILNDFQGMRSQLINRVGYCQHLQNQLKLMEKEISNRAPVGATIPNAQYQNAINKCTALQSEVSKLQKLVAEKQNKINQIQVNKSGYIQVTKQAFQSMQNNISSLQQKINLANESQRKQIQKSTNLQVQINKINKQFSEKLRRAEIQNDSIKRLQSQKSQLNSNLAKFKLQIKSLQKKIQYKENQCQKLKNQNQKNKKVINLNNQLSTQVEKYKKKFAESDQAAKKMVERLKAVQNKYNSILKENSEAIQFSKESKKKWEFYQKVLKQNTQNVMKLNEKLSKRGDQLDLSMKNCMMLQAKIKELTKKDDEDQIDKFLRQHNLLKEQTF